MKIRHFAISRTESEKTLADFFMKISHRMQELEKTGANIKDVIWNLDHNIDRLEQDTVTIFFELESADIEVGYATSYTNFKSDGADVAAGALGQSLESLHGWLQDHANEEIFDVSIELGLDDEGNHISDVKVYY